MKLILIYGPPASGKLTVANEVSKLTGFKVFHNHLSYDLAASVMPEGTDEFYQFCTQIRLESIEAAVKADVDGLIFTFCYASPYDDEFIRQLQAILDESESAFLPVRLKCPVDELKRRTSNGDRQKYQKIKSPEGIDDAMAKFDMLQRIPGVESLDIENGDGSAVDAANRIKEYYGIWF